MKKAKVRNRPNSPTGHAGWLPIAGVIVSMFLCSGILLFILSLAMYYLNLTSDIARIGICVIYALSTFTGGILIARIRRGKIFQWGIAMGAAYFLILLLVSLIRNGGTFANPGRIPLILALCLLPSLVGGLLAATRTSIR